MSIRIFSKPLASGGQVFRFHAPGKGGVSKPSPNESPEDAAKRVTRDAVERMARLTANDVKDMFIETKPGEIQHLPDWVRHDEMFDWAVRDGKIIELQEVSSEKQAISEAEQDTVPMSDAAAIAEAESRQPETPTPDGNARVAPPGAQRRRITGK